jgi:diaminohydroxyphosphoribosylaminopyrimidine deaminase/5-amino-6-(5-phosphoribosylamino)uracil reductase
MQRIHDFENCDIYVNLEPCSHFGKTPPCAPLIARHRFRRAIIGMQDPNPAVNGTGISIMRDAGIEVITGVMEKECRWLNRVFIHSLSSKLPYILVKTAQTLDGCIANENGDSKWITNGSSREKVHELRNFCDAVLIGRKTALKDDPKLTVRHTGGRNPLRVILDTNLTLPLELNLFKDEFRANTLVCCSPNASTSRKADVLKLAGVKICKIETDESGMLGLKNLLEMLKINHSVNSVLVEGGSGVLSTFAKLDLIDEMQIFVAPKIMGRGLHPFDSFFSESVNNLRLFSTSFVYNVDGDVQIVLTKKDM